MTEYTQQTPFEKSIDMDMYEDLKQEMLLDISNFFKLMRDKLLEVSAYGDTNIDTNKLKEDRVKNIEKARMALVNKWVAIIDLEATSSSVVMGDSSISGEYARKLRFYFRNFTSLVQTILLRHKAVSDIYNRLYNKDNKISKDLVRNMHRMVWSLLSDSGEGDLNDFQVFIARVGKDLCLTEDCNIEIATWSERVLSGVVTQAATRSILEEQHDGGKYYYMAAPPEAILDAKYGIDLIAIDKDNFNRTLKQLDVAADVYKEITESVGKESWVDLLVSEIRYKPLLEHVLLVQIKSHKGRLYGTTNAKRSASRLRDTLSIEVGSQFINSSIIPKYLNGTQEVPDIILKDVNGEDMRMAKRAYLDMLVSFKTMAFKFPGPRLIFIDMSIEDAWRVLASRH